MTTCRSRTFSGVYRSSAGAIAGPPPDTATPHSITFHTPSRMMLRSIQAPTTCRSKTFTGIYRGSAGAGAAAGHVAAGRAPIGDAPPYPSSSPPSRPADSGDLQAAAGVEGVPHTLHIRRPQQAAPPTSASAQPKPSPRRRRRGARVHINKPALVWSTVATHVCAGVAHDPSAAIERQRGIPLL